VSTTGDWTWLIYMAGDNNLEGAGRDDLAEMQKVGSSDVVNVLVQFDTEENRTTRYRVEKGELATLQTMTGVNCGDPKVLREFVQWGAGEYPAKHYLVDVWNHGGGWENLPPDYDYEAIRAAKPTRAAKLRRLKRSIFRTTIDRIHSRPVKERAIAIDCGAHDYLDNRELHDALAGALPDGQKVDLLGCDACLMNMFEIAYEMQDAARYMVGSEETEPGSGWPYTEILTALVSQPTMAPDKLAKLIANEYGKWYRAHGDPASDGAATQSALDLEQAGSVAAAVDDLAGAMMKDLQKSAGGISLARDKAQKFEMPEYVDLSDFCSQLRDRVTNSKIRKAASSVQSALSSDGTSPFVLANTAWGKSVKRAKGVSIYFPHVEDYSKDYAALRYSKKGGWRKFLEKFFQA
jgi:hypothetical protein